MKLAFIYKLVERFTKHYKMAVWLQIIGKRDSNSLEDERKKIFEIVSNINLDLSFLENTEFKSSYNPKNWRLGQEYNMEYYEYPLVDDLNTRFRSIRVIFNNPNFLEFSGPFDFFSEWFYLGDKFPEKISSGWRKIFEVIARDYKMNELIYFSEWFFATELIHSGEETAKELFECFEKYKENEKKSLTQLNHNEYYCENLG